MTSLIRYEAARKALDAAVSAKEVMGIHLTAKAIEHVAKLAKDFDMEIKARRLRVLAELKLGDMLKEGEKKGIIASRGKPPKGSETEPLGRAKLHEIGVDKKLSARSRELSGIGQRAVEAMLKRFENESHERGKIALDVIDREERDRRHDRRHAIERALADASARLEGERRFPTIYADPATKFLSGFGDRSIENHYPTLTTEQLCELKVADRALPDARLFIWTTVPQLANTFKIAAAWGFPDYSSHCVWDKTSPENENQSGTGHVFMNQHELLLYFKRGNPTGPKRGTQPLSIYRERKREHSRKPDYFRHMILEMTGFLPVLELFARVDAEHPLPEGFIAWGNQAGEPLIDVDGRAVVHDGMGEVIAPIHPSRLVGHGMVRVDASHVVAEGFVTPDERKRCATPWFEPITHCCARDQNKRSQASESESPQDSPVTDDRETQALPSRDSESSNLEVAKAQLAEVEPSVVTDFPEMPERFRRIAEVG